MIQNDKKWQKQIKPVEPIRLAVVGSILTPTVCAYRYCHSPWRGGGGGFRYRQSCWPLRWWVMLYRVKPPWGTDIPSSWGEPCWWWGGDIRSFSTRTIPPASIPSSENQSSVIIEGGVVSLSGSKLMLVLYHHRRSTVGSARRLPLWPSRPPCVFNPSVRHPGYSRTYVKTVKYRFLNLYSK